jgi:hypothetical protein
VERGPYGRDLSLSIRMLFVSVVLLALYAGLMFLSVWFAYDNWSEDWRSLGVPFVVPLGIYLHFAVADRLVLSAVRAKLVERDEAPDLHGMVERLAGAWLGRWRFGGRDFSKRERDFRELLIWPFEKLFGFILFAFGTLLTFAISRYREYAADRGSALATGHPENLMSALQKLASEAALIPRRDLRALAGLNAFFIVSVKPRRFVLNMDHPPLEKRLARLAEMARELGKVAR